MKLTKSTKNQPRKTATTRKKTVGTKRTSTAKSKPIATTSIIAPPEITTEAIAACAYALWEKDGRPHGRDTEYWLQAESQLKQGTQSFAE